MCLISFAYKQHAKAPLVVIANRDEFYNRPTQSMHWWQDRPILAGLDLQAGGTWLGLSKTGRLAAVTNYRQLKEGQRAEFNSPSRGNLVTDFLCSNYSAEQWYQSVRQSFDRYQGFNLLLYDGDKLSYLNNFQDCSLQTLKAGVYGLSNHSLDSPWPKVDYARQQIHKIVAESSVLDDGQITDLLDSLSLQKTYPSHMLPNTGVPEQWEKLLSSPFISSQDYGTRCSTAVVIASNELVNVAERTYSVGEDPKDLVFRFKPRL